MGKSTSQLATPRLDPLTVLRDTSARFRRLGIVLLGNSADSTIRAQVYLHEADRLDDLISLCDGTGAKNASADTLPLAAETIDGTSDTLPLMPRSGLTPQR
jgi:hypothetical protein